MKKLFLALAAVVLITASILSKPSAEKKYSVQLSKDEWTFVIQTIADSNIPMNKGVGIINAINAQIQLQDTAKIKK